MSDHRTVSELWDYWRTTNSKMPNASKEEMHKHQLWGGIAAFVAGILIAVLNHSMLDVDFMIWAGGLVSVLGMAWAIMNFVMWTEQHGVNQDHAGLTQR